jgi:DNA-binding NarL/FixJ family response regulator
MESGAQPIRIAVLGGHVLFRETLTLSLSSQDGFAIEELHTFAAEEALELVQNAGVDVVLVSFNPGDTQVIEFVTRLRASGFRGGLIVITPGISDRETLYVFDHCRVGIFLKDQPLSMLKSRIRAEMAKRPMRIALSTEAPNASLARPELSLERKITSREAAVLRGVSEGLSNKAIACQLGISENTVKTFVQHLFRKTGAISRSQLVRTAIEDYAEEIGNSGSKEDALRRGLAATQGRG